MLFVNGKWPHKVHSDDVLGLGDTSSHYKPLNKQPYLEIMVSLIDTEVACLRELMVVHKYSFLPFPGYQLPGIQIRQNLIESKACPVKIQFLVADCPVKLIVGMTHHLGETLRILHVRGASEIRVPGFDGEGILF